MLIRDSSRSGGAAADAGTLPVGHRLGDCIIEKVLGAGGFGIVYRAREPSLQRLAAIKEYMPAGLVRRNSDHAVALLSERDRGAFEAGRRSFMNEARLLARFDFPALVKVHRFWEENGTAYMAMPYYDGVTLRARLKSFESPADRPTERWLKRMILPLLQTLESLHRENCFHRDIAPDNVLLLADDMPMLLDFGAARRVVGGMTQDLTAILKPGYAPIEQYGTGETIQQGPWTDVYGVAALLYYAVTGRTPPSALARAIDDAAPGAAALACGRFAPEFLAAIDAGLCVNPEHRPQTIGAFKDLLFGTGGKLIGQGSGAHKQRAPVTTQKIEAVARAALARENARALAADATSDLETAAPRAQGADRQTEGSGLWSRLRSIFGK